MFPDPFKAPPSLLLKMEPLRKITPTPCKPTITEVDPDSFSTIPEQMVQQSMGHYEINPLYRYLSKIYGEVGTEVLFKEYGVGTSKMWGGSTIFWQRDHDGAVRTGKIMGYNPDNGHRVKQPHPQMHWAHCLVPVPQKSLPPTPQQRGDAIPVESPLNGGLGADFHLRQCYFGEHLVGRYTHKDIAIVESEKTAIVASVTYPKAVWIATGGISNLRPSKALRGRNVILIPDMGAEDRWAEKMMEIKKGLNAPLSIEISPMLAVRATCEQRSQGFDLADHLLKEYQ